MYAIGMVNLQFVVNLKFSRAVEGKNILKLPLPTLEATSSIVLILLGVKETVFVSIYTHQWELQIRLLQLRFYD